jgi:hypothetical protein
MKSKREFSRSSDGRRDVVAISSSVPPDSLLAGGGRDCAGDGDSEAGWSSISITRWDQPSNADRRSDKIRSWRRRALLKRGASLHITMVAEARPGSLAMLDETGIVVCWYGSPDGRDYTSEEVVDRHLSLFYVSEDVARRQPHRDLRAAVVDGRVTRQTWRRRPDGSAFWGIIDIEPVVLRDGRVQGFSYRASAPEQVRPTP